MYERQGESERERELRLAELTLLRKSSWFKGFFKTIFNRKPYGLYITTGRYE
jgi:hypothetical protein